VGVTYWKSQSGNDADSGKRVLNENGWGPKNKKPHKQQKKNPKKKKQQKKKKKKKTSEE